MELFTTSELLAFSRAIMRPLLATAALRIALLPSVLPYRHVTGVQVIRSSYLPITLVIQLEQQVCVCVCLSVCLSVFPNSTCRNFEHQQGI